MTSQVVLPQGVLGQGQQILIPGQTNGQGTPIVIPAQAAQAVQTTASNERKFNTTAGLVTGILQLLIGIIEVIATAVAISLGSEYRWFWGIWAGIGLYGVGGVLGVISKSSKNKGVVVAYMVFSIISSFVAPCHMIYEAVASSHKGYFGCGYCDSFLYSSCDVDCYTTNGPSVAHGIAAVVAAVEIFVAIVAACYGCCGTCCAGSCATGSTSVTQGQTYIIQYTQGTQPQTVTTAPNQQFAYPSAPVNLGYTASPKPADPPPAYAPLGPGVSKSQPYQALSTPTTSQPQPYESIGPDATYHQPYQELSTPTATQAQPYESLGPDATPFKPYQELSSPPASSQPHYYSTRVETDGQGSAPPAEDPMYIEIDQ